MPPTTQSRLLSDTLAMRETIEKDFYSSQRVLGYPAYDNFVKMGKEIAENIRSEQMSREELEREIAERQKDRETQVAIARMKPKPKPASKK